MATMIDVEIVRKPEDQFGFAVHAKRWGGERVLTWISRNRRLWNDPEAILASAMPLRSLDHPARSKSYFLLKALS